MENKCYYALLNGDGIVVPTNIMKSKILVTNYGDGIYSRNVRKKRKNYKKIRSC